MIATKKKTTTITCCATGATANVPARKDGSAKLPTGWKRLGNQVFSAEGLKQSYCLRCLKVPVASVVEGYEVEDWTNERSRAGWLAFRESLRTSFRQVAQLKTWVMFRLAGLDTKPLVQQEGKQKLPLLKFDQKKLYNEVRRQFPDLDSQSAGDCLRHAISFYKRNRWKVRVEASQQLGLFRNPSPIPIPEKDSPLFLDQSKRPCVHLRISGKRFTIRLKSGHGFRQYAGHLRGVADGTLVRGTALLRRKKDGDIVFLVPVWIPRPPQGNDKTLLLSTHANHLLVAEVQGEEGLGEPFRNNEDQFRRWAAELRYWQTKHKEFRLRFSEDSKREKRRSAEMRRQMQRKLDERCEKNRLRVQDRLRKIAASVADYANRRKCFAVIYDDSIRTYLPDIPYECLRRFLKDALEAISITLVCGSASEETHEEE